MLYCNTSPEILVKLLEQNFNKTKYKSQGILTLYESGMISHVSSDTNRYIFANGEEYLLTKPFPIFEKVDKTFEITWEEYIIKDDLLTKFFINRAKSDHKEYGELEEETYGDGSNGIKIIYQSKDFIGYIDRTYGVKCIVGSVKAGNKYIGTIFKTDNEKTEKVLKKIYKNYKLADIEDGNIEKGIIELIDEAK